MRAGGGSQEHERASDRPDSGRSAQDQDACVIFLHIGKTAGTTFRTIVNRHFRRSEIHTLPRGHPDDALRPPREGTLKDFARLPEDRRGEFRLIQGHTIFGLHELIPRTSTYITLLRDPVALVRSQYEYVRRWKTHHLHDTVISGGMSLRDYIESGVSLEMDNSQTRAIAGDVETPFGRCPPEMLTRAKEHIERHFALVGLTERFDETLILLNRVFGWSRLRYVRSNVAPQRRRQPLPKATLDAIHEHTGLDSELYRFAQQRFDELLEEDLAADRKLRRLQTLNALYRPWGTLTQTLPRSLYRRMSGKGRDAGP